MRTVKRFSLLSSASLLTALSLVLGAASVAAAAEPSAIPTVGGTLSAEGKNISVYSNGNVPAHVTLSATDVKLSETSFDIQSGETHSLTFSGPKAVGTVTALYTTIPTPGTEAGSAELVLNLIPGKVPPPSPWGPILLTSLLLLAVLFLLWRFRPWRYRLSLSRVQDPQA